MNNKKTIITAVTLMAAISSISVPLLEARPSSPIIDTVAPQLNFRSPSRDTVAKVIGFSQKDMRLWEMKEDDWSTHFFIRPAFKQSFRTSHIADCLFGTALIDPNDDDCSSKEARSFRVTGSNLSRRNDTKDLMAENFYLPRQFSSTVTVNPRVQTILVDFNLYMTFGGCLEGLYCRLYGPYVNSRYDLRFSESEPSLGNEEYAEGFFASAAVPVSGLLDSFTAYARGDTLQNIPVSSLRPESAVTAQGLQFAKISSEKITRNCLADLRFELGYNVCNEQDQHLGIHLHIAAPTGSRPEPAFLFSPQCGNNKCWEVGAGLSARHRVCTFDNDTESTLDFMVEADVTHMFNSLQKRTFDLKEKPLSRYMLAQKMTPFSEILKTNVAQEPAEQFLSAGFTQGVPTRPNFVFDGSYAPVANFSTREMHVSAGFQADVTALFSYNCDCFTWDLGYNFWTRSCETIKLSNCESFPNNTWALKGDAHIFGFQLSANVAGVINGPVALSATQSKADIHVGRNKLTTDLTNAPPEINPNVDNSTTSPQAMARADAILDDSTNQDILANATPPAGPIGLSFQPILITEDDLDLSSAETRGLSHKLFTHVNYTFSECNEWTPYLGVGAEVEFGRRNKTDDGCIRCSDCALSQWGIWIKTGASFNGSERMEKKPVKVKQKTHRWRKPATKEWRKVNSFKTQQKPRGRKRG